VKSDRRKFFERLINPLNVPPSRGYIALTQILHLGRISTVLTTNFDQCLERARILNNRPHRLVSISTPADDVMFSSAPLVPAKAISVWPSGILSGHGPLTAQRVRLAEELDCSWPCYEGLSP
jgi:hypothetical protein